MSALDPRELLLANLGRVREIVAFLGRRHRLSTDQQAELEAHVRLKLLEDDYAILRRFQGRSSLGTYLTVVIGNLAHDHARRERARWRATTAEPVAAGERERPPAREHDPHPSPEQSLLLRHAHASIARAVAGAFRRLQPRDRLLLRLRYVESATVPSLARLLDLAPRTLERRLAGLLTALRRDLEKAGVDPGDVRALLAGIPEHELGFVDPAHEGGAAASPTVDEPRRDDERG
jgi:RNA polymerase sigma factor for flagellar operon FliA